MHIPGMHPPFLNATIRNERVPGIVQYDKARRKVIPVNIIRVGDEIAAVISTKNAIHYYTQYALVYPLGSHLNIYIVRIHCTCY